MNIVELRDCEVNRGLAYVLGLIFPLYKTKTVFSKDFVLGCVNHNLNMVTQNDLTAHFQSVYRLLENTFPKGTAPQIRANKTNEYSISSKAGFSVLIEKCGNTDESCLEILSQKVSEISAAALNVRQEFVKGCFDGRSSWDTTYRLLALDVDRDYIRQDLILSIMDSVDVSYNINRREHNHPKNDQIRMKKDSVNNFLNTIGMYSVCRFNIISRALQNS